MFNVLKLAATAGATFIIAAMTSCSDNKHIDEASAMLDSAKTLVAAHDYQAAITTLDSLDKKYRDCLDVRREGTRVRLTALADLSRDSLASAELQLSDAQSKVALLAPRFRKIEVDGTAGYYVDNATYTGREMNSTGIQARVDDEGYCFVVANVAGRRIGLNSICFGNVSTPASESVEIEGSEIMSLTQEIAAPLIEALAACPDKSATVVLAGTKGKVNAKLNAKQIEAFRTSWDYANALQRQRRLLITLEKLTRQLQRLDDQIANATPVPEEEK